MRIVSKAEKLMHELAAQAAGHRLGMNLNPRKPNPSPPGEFIKRLSEEKREILKQLTSEEISDIRL